MDSKGGSWQQSGGLLQPPWLFRRKASPTRGAKKKTIRLDGLLFAFFAQMHQRFADQHTVAIPTERAKEVAKAMPRCRWQEEGRCFVVQRSIFSRRRRSPQKISGTANVHSISQLYLIGIARAITRWFKWGKGSPKSRSRKWTGFLLITFSLFTFH